MDFQVILASDHKHHGSRTLGLLINGGQLCLILKGRQVVLLESFNPEKDIIQRRELIELPDNFEESVDKCFDLRRQSAQAEEDLARIVKAQFEGLTHLER